MVGLRKHALHLYDVRAAKRPAFCVDWDQTAVTALAPEATGACSSLTTKWLIRLVCWAHLQMCASGGSVAAVAPCCIWDACDSFACSASSCSTEPVCRHLSQAAREHPGACICKLPA